MIAALFAMDPSTGFAKRVRGGTPTPVPTVAPPQVPIVVFPDVPTVFDACSYYDGRFEDFDFRDEPNESVGVCEAAWDRADPRGDGVLEALDLIAASGRYPTQLDWDGKTPYGILINPAAAKECRCVARPFPKEFMTGSPGVFWGAYGASKNCGVRRGEWQFESCKSTTGVDPGTGGSCPTFALLKQASEGPGGVRNQVFGLTGSPDPSDVFGLTVYGHDVSTTGFNEVGSHAKWFTALVGQTTPDQWNSAGKAPFGANGFPPRIDPVFNSPDSAMLYLYLDDANQAVPWFRSTVRPECNTGGCPGLSSVLNLVEGDRRVQVFNLSGMFSVGDAVGFKIYGHDVYVKYEVGMDTMKLAELLSERIRSITPDEWAAASGGQKSVIERIMKYPIEIGVGTDGTNTVIKMTLDPAQLAMPILISSKGSCTPATPFKFDPPGGSLGVIDQGASGSMTVAVFNVSGRVIKGCSIFPSDPDNFQIKAGPECDGLDVGGACKFELIGSPSYSAYGSVAGNIYIACGNDLAMSDVAGFRYEVGAMISAPDLQLKPLTLDFGTVKVGTASTAQSVTIHNLGEQEAQSCKVNLTNADDFLIKNPEACFTVPGKGSCTMDLVAYPKTDGAKQTTLLAQCTNALGQSTPDGIMVNFTTATPTPTPFTTPAPMSLLSFTTPSTADFGTVVVGETGGPLSLTVINSGTLDATLCKLALTGPDAGQFQLDTTCASVPASGCQAMCQKNCPVGDLCDYDVKLSCCVDYSNPSAPMECPLCKPGSCTFSISGRPTVAGAMKSQVSLSCGSGGFATSAANGVTMNATQPAGTPTPTPTPSCAMEGAVQMPSGDCVCPSGYEVGTGASGAQVCRPVVPSSEFAKAGDSFSDGFPVCGTGRMPLTSNFFLSDISTQSRPLSSYKVTKLGNTYPFAKDNSADPAVVLPQYLYSAASLKRCVCSASDVAYDASTSSTSTGKMISGTGRFVSDLYEVIAAASTSNPNPDTYATVPIAHDGSSNGYLGSLYYPGHGGSGSAKVSCGCPNLNEKVTAVASVAGSGYSCSPALDTSDPDTQKYMVLANFDPAVHDPSAAATQLLDRASVTAKITRVQVPTSSGGYRTYNRRIWTCAPPTYLDVTSRTCKIKESVHVCDNGDSSGVPSPVSQNLSGATAKDQFNNAANPKLACCLNSFDRKNPGNPLKYDCIQNADQSPVDFESLWMSTDPSEAGGQGNAIVLTDGSGRPVTGFFTLTGARCGEYSEFAGPIREATVNPAQIASQQNLSGNKFDQNFIQFSGNVIGPPPRASSWFSSKKTVPDLAAKPAQASRECPILARAALVVTCGSDNVPGQLPQQFTDSKGHVHCLAAKSIRVHLRIQQVYKITGTPPIKTFDSIMDLDEAKRTGINMEGMIRARAGAFCPAGSSYLDGNCLFK